MITADHPLSTAALTPPAMTPRDPDGAGQTGRTTTRHRTKLSHSLHPLSQPDTGSAPETGMSRR